MERIDLSDLDRMIERARSGHEAVKAVARALDDQDNSVLSASQIGTLQRAVLTDRG